MSATNAYKSNNIISFLFLFFIWIVFNGLIFLDVTLNLSDYQWSCIFISIIVLIFILRYVNKINIVSLYSIFFLTTMFFIGGRFLAVFLGNITEPIFEINFFVYHRLNNHDASILFYWVMLGFLSLELGLYINRLYTSKHSSNQYENLYINNNKFIIYFLFTLFAVSQIQQTFEAFQNVISGGYGALFSAQGEKMSYEFNISLLFSTLAYASSGIFLVQNNKRLRILFLILLGIISVSALVMGGRGGFVSFLLFLIWYAYDYGKKKASATKFFFTVILLMVFLSTIVQFFSYRELENSGSTIYENITNFLYAQGITLMVFNESMKIEHYPINAYFQNFIAGFTFFYSKLVGPVQSYEATLVAYTSYKLNSEEFFRGFGLGFSIFSEGYIYGLRNPILYSLFLAMFSNILNYLQTNINKNIYIKILTLTIAIKIFTLPRATFNDIVPLLYYTFAIFFIIRLFPYSKK